MSSAVTLEGLWARLPVEQRERLAQIQQHPRTRGVIASLTKGSSRPVSSSSTRTKPGAPVVRSEGGRVELLIPGLRLDVTPNSRLHWAERTRIVREQREAVRAALAGVPLPALPLRVELTRVGPRALDGDNAVASLKASRDGIADALGLADDSDPRVEWVCAQALPHASWRYGLRVVIRSAGGAR